MSAQEEAMNRRQWMAMLALLAPASGCVAAAAGAGAAGAIYVLDRGVESTVTTDVANTELAVKRSFRDLGITETRSATDREGGSEKRTLEGKKDDRDVSVSIETAGTGSKVVVIVKRSAVTWDKDMARQIMEKIIAEAK